MSKTGTPAFLRALGPSFNLLDSVIFTRRPARDDCQQLLRILFTTEEKERILEARKLIGSWPRWQPTTNPALIDQGFLLTRSYWYYHTGEGKGRLKVYCWILMMGGSLRAAARQSTNLAKVTNVQQEKNKSPFLICWRH